MPIPAFTPLELTDLALAHDLIVMPSSIVNNPMMFVVCGNRNRIALKIGYKDDGKNKVYRLLHLFASMDGEFLHPTRQGMLVPHANFGMQHTWAATLHINDVFEAAKVNMVQPTRAYSKSDEMAWKVSHHYTNKTCAYCFVKLKLSEVTIDHIIPKSRGGLHEPSNWAFACKKCNDAKADMTPEEFLRARRRTA